MSAVFAKFPSIFVAILGAFLLKRLASKQKVMAPQLFIDSLATTVLISVIDYFFSKQ